jgi:transposase
VSEGVVKKIRSQFLRTGRLEPDKRGPKGQRTFSTAQLNELKEYVLKHNDVTLEQLWECFGKEWGVKGVVPFHRALKMLGFRYKKNPCEQRSKIERTWLKLD